MNIKFFIKGKEEFQTLLAGGVGIIIYAIVALIVY
jgi:hypothetical protein